MLTLFAIVYSQYSRGYLRSESFPWTMVFDVRKFEPMFNHVLLSVWCTRMAISHMVLAWNVSHGKNWRIITV